MSVDLGKRIKKLRAEKNISQEELAKKLAYMPTIYLVMKEI